MKLQNEPTSAISGRGVLPRSFHCKSRQQQRCIPQFVIDALVDFGDERFLGDGHRSFSFSKRSWKRLCGYMGRSAAYEKYRNAYVVLAENGTVITVAWRH